MLWFATLSIAMLPAQIADQEHRDAIVRANAAVQAAIPGVSDPERPGYHFVAPALWMNDPNGPIFYKGWFHLFYQHNPYGDRWGKMHWGHARSRDLVRWEHLPIALGPTKSKGEDHIYSGSAFLDRNGQPTILYTSIGGGREPEQWAAVPDEDDLMSWHKFEGNPVLSQAANPSPIAEWRDPYVFKIEKQIYMAVGGGLKGRGIVALYRSTGGSLTSWEYMGILFEHPDAAVRNIECPNIVKLGKAWVVLVSVRGRVESFVGNLDPQTLKFVQDRGGVLDEGSYASQVAVDGKGRQIHLAWVPTEDNKGWNGWLTLPSVLSLSPEGVLLRTPAPELASLRTEKLSVKNQVMDGTLDLRKMAGDSLEILAEFDPGSATSIEIGLRSSKFTITYDAKAGVLRTPGRSDVKLPEAKTLKLRIFLDRQAVDIFAAGGAITQTTRIRDVKQGDNGIAIYATGGVATIKELTIYKLKPARM